MDSSFDKFLGGDLLIKQSQRGFKSGSDAVFLASWAPPVSRILDVGSGTGVVSLCMARRMKNSQVVGLDCQEEMVSLAQHNAEKNDLENRVSFVRHTIGEQNLPLSPQSFDHVVTNPPYFEGSVKAQDPSRSISRMLEGLSLKTWVSFCLKMLKPRGSLTLIYPASCLQKLLGCFPESVGSLEIFPLFSKEGEQASRLLVRIRKDVKSPSLIHGGLIVHEKDGSFTPRAHSILWEGAALMV